MECDGEAVDSKGALGAAMAVLQEEKPIANAEGIRWDLGRIYPSIEDARGTLTAVLGRAKEFEQQYRGIVASLDPAGLADALERLGVIQNEFMRVESYASLRFEADSRDTDTKDLLDRVALASQEFRNALRFFDLEWQALPADRATALANDEAVEPWRHYLEKLTDYAPHMKTEAEERMLVARETAAVSEWQKLFSESINTIEVEFDAGSGPQAVTLDRLLALQRHPDRAIRFASFEKAYEVLEPRVDVQAACYNAIVGDRLQMDRLRGFSNPMQATNLANDLPDEVVDTLVESITSNFPLARRWFTIKAKILGLPKLNLCDQYAPLGTPKAMDFSTAWADFVSSTRNFSPEVERQLSTFLDGNRIDAEPRIGKSGGAFCTPVAWGDEPFMLMNFTDDARSLETLAHEAGHGLQFILIGQRQKPLSGWMGLPMAEIASTFHETHIVNRQLEKESDPAQRRLMLAGRIEGSFATIFRQTTMVNYERRAYAMKADSQALTADRLSDIWFRENGRYYGDAVELPEAYRRGWSYVPHFIGTRFYTYAYAFAHLASLALYAKYREQGESFVQPYLDLLGAGGAESPQNLLAAVGIDITDPGWTAGAFKQIEDMIDAIETEVGEA
jgi:oligoendopeptidase F